MAEVMSGADAGRCPPQPNTNRAGASAVQRGHGLWWAIIVITGTTSMALNVVHAVVYRQGSIVGDGAVIDLSQGGRIVLGVVAGVLPVLMGGLLSHSFAVTSPTLVRLAVAKLFTLGMGMSLSAQVELLTPVIGWLRALGTAIIIDVSALLSLFMIEYGNRVRKAADRRAAERSATQRQAAEQARRESETAKRRQEERASAERLAAEQRAAAEAQAARAEAERLAAAERAAVERCAVERAEAERQTAVARAEADQRAAERAEAERLAAEQRAAERERAQRAAAQREALQRDAFQRQARAERRQAVRRAWAERLAEHGPAADEGDDLPPEQKETIIRAEYGTDSAITAAAVAATVIAAGGQMSEPRARAILAKIRREAADGPA
ncbi:hypothetical protein AB0I81_05805 [Nonomuraea sp. NPDC050404]|uniref:hypothetical protein n=1 Tax=Nonomuraea sp. NPDC050404 TaxID=3155783 RepID=UPI0033D1D495